MKILEKKILGESKDTRITRIRVAAPEICQKALAGQFVVVMAGEEGERIPLTIVECDPQQGALTLIFQETGLTTRLLGGLNAGDSLYALVGPLGHPTEIKEYGKVILVGGGVGIAEIYPVAKAMRGAGNQVTTILGARTKPLLILEEELRGVSHECLIATDDGSYQRKGFTTDILAELLQKDTYALVYAVGPLPMMRKAFLIAQGHGVKTIVSLNALMVDATGMCGCCRVTVGGKTLFSCVDGPEFEAGLLDWDELIKRTCMYREQEKHICQLSR